MSETTCSQVGCEVEVTGLCLEGFASAEKCPYYAQPEAADEGASYDSQELVAFPSGEALSERQATEVTREDVSKVVIVAGPTGSGKTTILTSLFEAFLEAPFANYLFRGSRTLVGFERRCHLGREESSFDSPDTAHTSMREGVVFLHLDLASNENGRLDHMHLLLSDISGELFVRLRDSGNAAQDVPALRRANHLCLAIDGEKLVRKDLRHLARNDSGMILRGVVESRALSSNCIIDVAFTKWDVIVADMDDNWSDTPAFIESTKNVLRDTAKNFEVRFHELAARPSLDAKVPFAHGLPTLLRSWMGRDQAPAKRINVFPTGVQSREFSRFTEAVIGRGRLEGHFDVHSL